MTAADLVRVASRQAWLVVAGLLLTLVGAYAMALAARSAIDGFVLSTTTGTAAASAVEMSAACRASLLAAAGQWSLLMCRCVAAKRW